MENFSENKVNRGRPKESVGNHRQSTCNLLNPDVTTRRSKDNYFYYFIGLKLIGNLDGFEFLWDKKAEKIKITILSGIGRITLKFSDEKALEVARTICDKKLSTAKALSFISVIMHGEKEKTDSLIFKILNILEGALITDEEALKVLEGAAEIVKITKQSNNNRSFYYGCKTD